MNKQSGNPMHTCLSLESALASSAGNIGAWLKRKHSHKEKLLNRGVAEERGLGRGSVDPTCCRKIRQVASRCGMRTHAIPIRRGVSRTTTLRAEIEWQ